MILDYIFEGQSEGMYLDIGCYHPVLFSNTKKLYDKGWSGVNIDANIDTIKLFNEIRPKDININIAIAETRGESEYFKFLEIDAAGGGSGNSLSSEVREKYENQGLTTTVSKIKTDTLISIYNKYLAGKAVDFCNIDVEGLDLAVLKSNDWNMFRPRVIAVEIWAKDIDFDNPMSNETYAFLREKSYKAFSNTIFTWFFYDMDNPLRLE